MPELVCDTTVIQYLHQIGLLGLLPTLASSVCVPAAVAQELEEGRIRGIDLPEFSTLDWLRVLSPEHRPRLPDAGDLGPGESEVLWLTAERPERIAVLDDGKARQAAAQLGLPFTGLLGLLLDSKRRGLIVSVGPHLAALRNRNFHLSPRSVEAILRQTGESP